MWVGFLRMEWTLRWSTLCGEGGGVLVILSAGSTTLSEVPAYHTDALNNAAVEVLNIQQFNRTPIPTYCAHSNSYLVM